jgi:hypothetical protein
VIIVVVAAAALRVVIPMLSKSTSVADASAQPPANESEAGTGDTLAALLSIGSLVGGAAFQMPSNPQNNVLNWLAGNANLESYTDKRRFSVMYSLLST